MGFINVRLPTNANYGSGGGPGYRTGIASLRSGAEQRFVRQSAPRWSYDASYTIRTVQDAYDLVEFFISVEGASSTFRWKDWGDYATAADGTVHHGNVVSNTDVLIGAGDGSTTQFQLIKTYANLVSTKSRTIQLPVAGTVLVAVGGVALTEGVDFSVNEESGLLTFVVAPADGEDITAGFQFDVPVRFDEQVDISLFMSIDSFDSNSVPSVPLIEDISTIAAPELTTNGGAKDFGVTAIVQTISLANGRALRFAPTAAHNINFPDATGIEPGGPIFFLINDGSEILTGKYSDAATTIGTIAAGARSEFWLSENTGSGLKEWQQK